MRYQDTIWLGIKGISERKVRTALTVLTVVIGVAAIVALISLVAGVSASISKALQSIGPTTLYMNPSGATGIFTAADVAEIEAFPNVTTVIPLISARANVTINGKQESVTILGINNYSLVKAIGSVNLYRGTTFNQTVLPVAVVGHTIAFPDSSQVTSAVPLNQPLLLTINNRGQSKSATAIPVGILNSYGTSAFISPDSSIFMPLEAVETLTNKYSYTSLMVQASNATTVAPLDSLLNNIYGNRASIISVQQIASTVSSVTGSLAILLGSVAGVSLLVAGISILSIMMVSVTERTKEIGTLKAIGFKKRDILTLFLTEAVVIGLLGGIIGTAVGGGTSYILSSIFSGNHTSTNTQSSSSNFGNGNRPANGGAFEARSGASTSSSSSFSFTPVLSLSTIVLAIAIALIVSVLSSLYPAWKAASVDPIQALRTE